MVKLYCVKDKHKYIDISIWSLLKASILTSLLFMILFYGILFIVGIIYFFI